MTDYVVTRKRKRYAIDPCLGYYMYATSSDGVGESTCSNLANEQIAHIGIDSLERVESAPPLIKPGDQTTMRGNTNRPSQDGRHNQPQLQELDVVTVETFLKSSARTYRHRKLWKRQVNLNDRRSSADAEQATRSSYSRRDSTLRRSSTGNHGEDKNFNSHRKGDSKNTRRRNRKPLKERLYEAAILTHGEPDNYYTRSEAAENMASNRTALLFVPYEHASRDRAVHSTHTKALIVDPRKSMAMQTASLACRSLRGYTDSGLLSHTLDRIPLSKWNLTLNDGRHVKTAPKQKESKATADMAFTYPPLRFVSFQEAERNYKAMFPGAGNGHFLEPHTLTKIASPSLVAPESANYKADAHDCSGRSERRSITVSGILPGIPLTTATLRASVESANSTNTVDIGPLPGHPQPTAILPHSFVSGEPSACGAFGRAKDQSSLRTLRKDGSPAFGGTPRSQTSDTQSDMVGN